MVMAAPPRLPPHGGGYEARKIHPAHPPSPPRSRGYGGTSRLTAAATDEWGADRIGLFWQGARAYAPDTFERVLDLHP